MSYDLIFSGIRTHSMNVFKVQRRAVRIMVGAGNRDSLREIFKLLKILTLISPFILSRIPSVVVWLITRRGSIITTQITITSWHINSQLNTDWVISLHLLLKLLLIADFSLRRLSSRTDLFCFQRLTKTNFEGRLTSCHITPHTIVGFISIETYCHGY
jgi:hypothetical protein